MYAYLRPLVSCRLIRQSSGRERKTLKNSVERMCITLFMYVCVCVCVCVCV